MIMKSGFMFTIAKLLILIMNSIVMIAAQRHQFTLGMNKWMACILTSSPAKSHASLKPGMDRASVT